jgi:hypothetical protein
MAATGTSWADHGRAFSRIARREMRGLLAGAAHRIEIVSLASRHAAHAWYEGPLRMRDEGLLAGWFADGQDARIHAITKRKEA